MDLRATLTARPFSSEGCQLSVQNCTFKETSYADGEGDGQAIYAVTSNYGAKVACHAFATAGVIKDSARAKAIAGDTIIWGGKDAHPGRVKLPWIIRGVMRTSTQTGIGRDTEAEADVVVRIGIWDQTDNTREVSEVGNFLTEGQSEERVAADSRSSGEQSQFSLVYVPGHKYTAYIEIEAKVKAKPDFPNILLSADAIADFFGDDFGAFLEFVEWEFDMPDGVRLICNVNEA